MKSPHTNVLVRMTPELKDSLEGFAKKNTRSLTKEINERLRVSLGAQGPTMQGILAREAFGSAKAEEPTAPGIAPSAPTLTTSPQGQSVNLSEHDMAMLRIFHALSVEKQLALLSLFK